MEQHPVPQHIASFEFKLFGNLTVRQFVTLAIPMTFAALIFFSPLPPVIRIPLAGILGIFGLIAALVPIGGRPFDKWVAAFIKAILSPTQRIWVKEEKLPDFLSVITAGGKVEEGPSESITTQGRERLLSYLRSLPREPLTTFDVKEQIAIERLGLAAPQASPQGAMQARLPAPIIWPTANQPLYAKGSLPQLNVGAGAKIPQEEYEYAPGLEESLPPVSEYHKAVPVPRIAPHAKPYVLPGIEKKLTGKPLEHVQLVKAPIAKLASDTNFTIENIIPIQTPDRRLKFIRGIAKTRVRKLHFAPPENFDLSKLPIRGESRFEVSDSLKKHFQILAEFAALEPQEAPFRPKPVLADSGKSKKKTEPARSVRRQRRILPKPTVSLRTPGDVSFKRDEKTPSDSHILIHTQKTAGQPALTLNRAQIVPLTNKPNIISGLVLDSNGAPIESVIIIIRDQNGIPQRALKTNKLGQFLSATPLADGSYAIEVESSVAEFNPVTITLNQKVLAPLEIKAKS